MKTEKRFIKQEAFERAYLDSVTGLFFGILTTGRGKYRKNVYVIHNKDYSFSTQVRTFKDAKQFCIDNSNKTF